MGGPARVVIDDTAEGLSAGLDGLFAEIEQLVAELEQRYSRYRDDSLVSLINRRAGSPQRTKIDAETIALLGLAEALWGDHRWLIRYHLRAASTRLGFPIKGACQTRAYRGSARPDWLGTRRLARALPTTTA